MATTWTIGAGLCLAIWLYLLGFRGGFWRCDERLTPTPEPADWPAVIAIVPARDEAASIREAITALLAQDYPGPFHVVLVDDESRDGTAEIARRAAAELGAGDRLDVVATSPRPAGWVGKVWAMARGLAHVEAAGLDARYLLFTDADIHHPPHGLRRLVAKAVAEDRDLVSLMVLLARRGASQHLLIPAFVFFFQKLYPFALVNRGRIAAAAGGCMLAARETLARAGGLEAIHDAPIDDCALAAAMRRVGGRLWLGLATDTRSLRPYEGLGGVWRMVARSAYTQLRYSPLLLLATLLAMVATYLAGPLAVLAWPWHGEVPALVLGLAAWGAMAVAFRPNLTLYGEPWPLALLLPVAGLLYALMTLESAWAHHRGRGGVWKGRVGAGAGEG